MVVLRVSAVDFCELVATVLFCFFCQQEHRMEIDARGGTFQAFEAFGEQLLQKNHYASDEVRAKLEELADARQNLEKSVPFFCCSNLNLIV